MRVGYIVPMRRWLGANRGVHTGGNLLMAAGALWPVASGNLYFIKCIQG